MLRRIQMVSSREIVEMIENKIAFERNEIVLKTLRSVVEDIEQLEDVEMRRMYSEFMNEDVLIDKWQELELELATKGR